MLTKGMEVELSRLLIELGCINNPALELDELEGAYESRAE